MDQKQTNQPTLEQAMRELERIVGEIEAGRLPLEEGLEKYERGNQLIEICRRILAKAEEQIAGLHAPQDQPGEPH